MINKDLFRTFFLVTNKEISIYVRNNSTNKIVFFKKKKIDKTHIYLNNEDILSFFFENIDEIENQIELFVDNISLVVGDENIFPIKFSLKQKIENRVLSLDEFKSLLLIGQEQINKYNQNLLIIHYLIDLLNIDGEIIESIENKFIKNYVCVDLRFICIDNKIVDQFKNLFKKKQIFLEKIFSIEYLKEYNVDGEDIINSIDKIENGINKLEVNLIPKKTIKKGFFETFFNYFS